MNSKLIRSKEDLGKFEEFNFDNQQSIPLKAYVWPAPQAKAIVIFVHGITSHAKFDFLNHRVDESDGADGTMVTRMYPKRYLSYSGSWIEAFNMAGVIFCAFDQQGHGCSGAWMDSRSNVEMFDDFAHDALQFMILVNSKYNSNNNLPIFIGGLSMGGGVVSRTIQLFRHIVTTGRVPPRSSTLLFTENKNNVENNSDVENKNDADNDMSSVAAYGNRTVTFEACKSVPLKGAMVFCPPFSLKALTKKLLNRVLLPFSGVASWLFPTARVGTLESNVNYPWIDQDRDDDAHPQGTYVGHTPARVSAETLKIGARAYAEVDVLADGVSNTCFENLSILIAHSKLDTFCDPSGSEIFYDKLRTIIKDCSFWLLDDLWHYLTLEDGNESLRDRTIAWVRERMQNEDMLSSSVTHKATNDSPSESLPVNI